MWVWTSKYCNIYSDYSIYLQFCTKILLDMATFGHVKEETFWLGLYSVISIETYLKLFSRVAAIYLAFPQWAHLRSFPYGSERLASDWFVSITNRNTHNMLSVTVAVQACYLDFTVQYVIQVLLWLEGFLSAHAMCSSSIVQCDTHRANE